MIDLNTDLADALKQAKKKPMCFAFIFKGPDSTLVVQKKRVSAKQVAEAKMESGGGQVYRGRCHFAEGRMIFEVAKEPPGTLATFIKRTIHSAAGMTMLVEVRLSVEEDAEPVDALTGEADDAAPVIPVGGEVTKRLNALKSVIHVGLAGPNKAAIQSLVASITRSVTSQDFASAVRALEELEPLLAPPAKAPSAEGTAVMQRFAALLPEIKVGLAGPEQANVRVMVDGVSNLIKKKGFAKAADVLAALEKLLAKTPVPTASSANDAIDRLNRLAPSIKGALAGPKAAQIQILLASTQTLIKGGDFAQASSQLDALEALVQASEVPDVAMPRPRIAPDIVYRQARLEYDRVRKAAQAGVAAVQQAILKAGEGDPQFAAISEGVARLNDALAGLDDGLLDTLDAALSSKETGVRQQHTLQAITQIKGYLQFIKSDELLHFVDTNAFLKAKVRAPLSQALKTLKIELTNAAKAHAK